MKRVLRDFEDAYEKKLDALIKPDEEEIFDSIEDVQNWLEEVINLEDASDNSL